MKMMTLKCAAGHTWERPSQRGKPPKFCPDHKPASTPVERVSAPSGPSATESLCERGLDAQRRLTDPEQVRQVDYIVGRLLDIDSDPGDNEDLIKRRAADKKMLSDRLEDIIRPRGQKGAIR